MRVALLWDLQGGQKIFIFKGSCLVNFLGGWYPSAYYDAGRGNQVMGWGGGGGSRRPSGEHRFKYWEGGTQWGEWTKLGYIEGVLPPTMGNRVFPLVILKKDMQAEPPLVTRLDTLHLFKIYIRLINWVNLYYHKIWDALRYVSVKSKSENFTVEFCKSKAC